jgi:molybdate transport system substrate-binding protein
LRGQRFSVRALRGQCSLARVCADNAVLAAACAGHARFAILANCESLLKSAPDPAALGVRRVSTERRFLPVAFRIRPRLQPLRPHARRPPMVLRRSFLLAFVLTLLAAPLASVSAQEKTLTVFAAASMKNALDDVNAAFTKQTGTKVVTSYAASSALMKQIESGAPADVFVSADLDWMDYGSKRSLVRDNSRVNLLGNRLVLIAPKDSKLGDVAIGQGFDLAKLAGNGRIATGDVKSVPVGKYAKAALEKLGAWAAAEPKFAMADNVRAALLLVARGEAALGIVYETDAKVEPGVKIVGVFPEGSHAPVTYPVAATANAKPEADAYLAFLRSGAAKGIFEKYGFSFLIKPVS